MEIFPYKLQRIETIEREELSAAGRTVVALAVVDQYCSFPSLPMCPSLNFVLPTMIRLTVMMTVHSDTLIQLLLLFFNNNT